MIIGIRARFSNLILIILLPFDSSYHNESRDICFISSINIDRIMMPQTFNDHCYCLLKLLIPTPTITRLMTKKIVFLNFNLKTLFIYLINKIKIYQIKYYLIFIN